MLRRQDQGVNEIDIKGTAFVNGNTKGSESEITLKSDTFPTKEQAATYQ